MSKKKKEKSNKEKAATVNAHSVQNPSDNDDGMSVDNDGQDESVVSNEDLIGDEGDVTFSGIILGNKKPSGAEQPNKPGSKMKKLKNLVAEAQLKQQKMQLLKSQGESGKQK